MKGWNNLSKALTRQFIGTNICTPLHGKFYYKYEKKMKNHLLGLDDNMNDNKSTVTTTCFKPCLKYQFQHTKIAKKNFNRILHALEQFYDKKYPNIGSKLSKQTILNLCEKEIKEFIILPTGKEIKIVSMEKQLI